MTTRGLLACLVLVSSSIGAFMACNLETNANYGNPSGLSHDHFPATNIDGSASGGDSGALCNGAGPIDGGTCQVKFSTDIWPLMAATGKWACADSNCHGGTALNPFINDPASAYANLTTYKVGGKPYVNPCTIDIDAASRLSLETSARSCSGSNAERRSTERAVAHGRTQSNVAARVLA
jgi:hypothetical protein